MIIDDKNSKKRVKNDLRTLPKKCRKCRKNAENCTKILTLIFVCVGSKNKNQKKPKIKKLPTSFEKIKIFFFKFF